MERKIVSGLTLPLVLIVIGMLTFAFTIQPVKASGTIYIKADGSVDPDTAPISSVDNVTYVFTGNSDSIVVERDNIVVDGAGYTLQEPETGIGVDLSDRSNVTIKNMRIMITMDFGWGIMLSNSSGNSISGNNISMNMFIDGYAIMLSNSSGNSISGNNIESNRNGIWLSNSSSNRISGNNITSRYSSITLSNSSGNSISGNNMRAYHPYMCTISLSDSSDNSISGNNIRSNYRGIWLSNSPSNSISGNNISISIDGNCAIMLSDSSNNKFYHNNFICKQPCVITSGYANFWDDGYPSGGNYWSDYTDIDQYSGPHQNETGTDGIWDHPYAIDANNTDNYPFIRPGPHPPWIPIPSFVYAPLAPIMGETVTFNASASYDVDGYIVSYAWDFGDGTNSTKTDPIITYIYTTVGPYYVTLTVTDNDSLTDATTEYIAVERIPTFISISTNSPSIIVGFRVDITGTLSDLYGNGLRKETVVLYYAPSGIEIWTPITSDTTDDLGNYRVMWIPPATGYFVIMAEWTGNATHFEAYNTATISSLVYEDQYVFSVESNSTLSELAFNTTDWTLSFTATGPNGTMGYTKVTVAKSLVANITNIRVYLDGNQSEYTITSTDDSWLLTFTYMHSTHQVAVDLDITIVPEFPSLTILLLFMIATLLAVVIHRRRKHTV